MKVIHYILTSICILIVVALVIVAVAKFTVLDEPAANAPAAEEESEQVSDEDERATKKTFSISNIFSSSKGATSSGGGGGGGSESGGSSEEPAEEIGDFGQPNYCTPESREVSECEAIQHPLCGWFSEDYTCAKPPCVQVFVNECEACVDERIEYWTEGECPLHG